MTIDIHALLEKKSYHKKDVTTQNGLQISWTI